MDGHKYILEPYKGKSTRYQCPGCQHRTKTLSGTLTRKPANIWHPTLLEAIEKYHYISKSILSGYSQRAEPFQAPDVCPNSQAYFLYSGWDIQN